MALSIQDLDQLLNYDASTHSFTGMPQIKPGAPPAAAPAAGMAPVSTTARAGMSPVKANDMALDMARTGMATAHPVTAMPSVGGAPTAPAAAPAVPTIGEPAAAPDALGAAMPSIAKPTGAQSHAAGKAEYEAGMPTMNDANGKPIAPGTEAYGQRRQEILDYQKAHPWGADVSEHPGFWGKLGHGLAVAGNVAGDILAPRTMENIPGTQLHREWEEKQAQKEITTGAENDMRKAASEEVPWIDQKTGAITMLPKKEWGTMEAAAERAGATTDAAKIRADASTENAETKAATDKEIAGDKSKEKLLSMGFDEKGAPLPDDKLSSQQRATRDMTLAHTKLQQAQAAMDLAKADPNSPAGQAAAASLALRQAEFQNKLEEQGLIKPSGQTQSRGDAAGAALQLLPGLEQTVRDNAKEFGPIMGRINRGEIKIGDVSPAVQQAYSQLESFYALQPSVHGFRNAEFVKDFDTFIGNLQTNPDAVIAGLEGLKPTLTAVEESGRTYKTRIMPGAPAAPATAPGAPAGGNGLPGGWTPAKTGG